MGIAQSALILLGIGIVSSRFKAGTGLQELGTGIQTLVAAPLVGTGTGLSTFSGGLRDLAKSLGDIGRGFSALFESIPGGKYIPPPLDPGLNGGEVYFISKPLITTATGDLDTGGGSRVPRVGISPAPAILTRPSYIPPPTTQPISVRPTNPNLVML